MTDRELLELAAKAAGYVIDVQPSEYIFNQTTWSFWNPLTGDSDAFALAVALKLHIGSESHTVSAWQKDQYGNFHTECFKDHNDDRSATRRAIVRAAAEIGRAMK